MQFAGEVGVRNRGIGGGREEIGSRGSGEEGEDAADETNRADLSLGTAEMDDESLGVGLGTQDLKIQGAPVPGEDDILPGGCTRRAPSGQILRGAEACEVAQGESCHGDEVVPGKGGPAEKGKKVLIKEGWGPSRGMVALKAPNGLGQRWSVNMGCGEAQIYSPGS